MAGTLLLLLVLVAAWWWRRGAGGGGGTRDEVNPTYGLYYFDDGNRIDESNSEVVDGNTYYQL